MATTSDPIAQLRALIDAFNEIALSSDIKDVLLSGQSRPTNAKVLSTLATQMSGALIYADVATGLAGTENGWFFSVLADDDAEYIILYLNDNGSAVEQSRYPSAVAARSASEIANAALALSQPRMLLDLFAWAVTDEDQRPILGVKMDGTAHAVLDQLPGLDGLGDYAWAVTDADGVVLLGIKWDGSVTAYGTKSTVESYVNGPHGGRDVYVIVDNVPYQITSTGDNTEPVVSDGVVRYVSRSISIIQAESTIPTEGSIAPFISDILHIVSSGQSLSMGAFGEPITLQPPTANRLLTIADGVRLANQDDTLTSEMIAPFEPLVSKTQEVPVVQLSAQLNRMRGLPGTAGLLASAHGHGGWSIAQLSKGTVPYSNSMTAVQGAFDECQSLGYDYRVPFVDWIQGEEDSAGVAGAYASALEQLQSDYQSDIQAISGQSGAIPILLDQISNWTAGGYNLAESNVPFEQLNVSLQHPNRFVCAGPKYWLPTVSDGVHLTSESYARLGAMHARAAAAIISGSSWMPTHCISATRVGLIVILEFHTPSGPLTVDTGRVTDPGNWGLRWVDDSMSASIDAIRLVGNNRVEVALDTEPTGLNPMIGIADIGTPGQLAGPESGVRCCLRDSSGDVDPFGEPLFNWACHQRIDVNF